MTKESKKELRARLKSIFKAQNAKQLNEKSKKIMAKIENSEEFSRAKTLALYHSLPDEPCTHSFIEKWAESKTILLPIVRKDEMFFCPYNIGMKLNEGSFSILEPDSNIFNPHDIDLIVVPAVAYDYKGFRLGRGKGFYDKFFAQYPNIPCIGVCFDYQYLPEVPVEIHDMRVDKIFYA